MRRVIIGLLLLIFAHTALGQSVKVKFDKTVDFSRYKTYFWVKGMPARNPIINQMITDAVDQQLSARGLTKTNAEGDLQIMFMAAVDLDLQVTGISWSNLTYPSGVLYRRPPPMDVRKGTLVVDMTDRKTERYVWRAVAKETLTQAPSSDVAKDAQHVERLVKKAVEKMFGKYPVTR